MEYYSAIKKKRMTAAERREISSVVCDHLEGWDRDGRGRRKREGIGGYMYKYS